jgi:hypothetical protein
MQAIEFTIQEDPFRIWSTASTYCVVRPEVLMNARYFVIVFVQIRYGLAVGAKRFICLDAGWMPILDRLHAKLTTLGSFPELVVIEKFAHGVFINADNRRLTHAGIFDF